MIDIYIRLVFTIPRERYVCNHQRSRLNDDEIHLQFVWFIFFFYFRLPKKRGGGRRRVCIFFLFPGL